VSKISVFWAGDMAQVVEYLCSEYKTLSSNPCTAKGKQKKRKKKLEYFMT
jgi:hypothetical protein